MGALFLYTLSFFCFAFGVYLLVLGEEILIVVDVLVIFPAVWLFFVAARQYEKKIDDEEEREEEKRRNEVPSDQFPQFPKLPLH